MKKFVTTILGFLILNSIISQIQYGGTPIQFSSSSKITTNSYVLNELIGEPYKRDSTGPLKVGEKRGLNINFTKDVEPLLIEDKLVYIVKIKSLGAKSISAYFDKLDVSPSTKVFFIHNDEIYGNYNYQNMITHENKRFKGPLIDGNEFVIQIEINENEQNDNEIVLTNIVHYFVNSSIFKTNFNAKSLSQNTDCQIDVNCSEGEEWCNQIRSAAMFLYTTNSCNNPGAYYCSGALINNTNNDFKQYFLTARHCTDCDIDWETVQFRFNSQRPVCDNGSNFSSSYNNYTVEGAANLEAYCDVSFTDNALIEILPKIPLQYNVFYSGWDINSQSLNTNLHIIHHPSWKVKKITSGQIQYNAGPKWDVYWDNGIIEGGSSGSPIFNDKNKKIIATLSGGLDYECDESNWHDWVGKIKDCWNVSSIGTHLSNGSSTKEWNGIDPILACQENINLYGIFRDAREYNALKHQIHLQADKKVVISNLINSIFKKNSNFLITANERITFLPDNIDGTEIEEGAIFSAYIAPCSLEGYCGYEENNENYQKSIESSFLVNESNNAYNVYPNPSFEDFNITFELQEEKLIQIQVLKIDGIVLYEKEFLGLKGTTTHEISLNTDQKILFTKICIGEDCNYAKLMRE